MKRLSDIVTVSLGAAALVTLVYAKDRPSPTPGVRTAIDLLGKRTHSEKRQPHEVKLPSPFHMPMSCTPRFIGENAIIRESALLGDACPSGALFMRILPAPLY
jgi:hypothetical protein